MARYYLSPYIGTGQRLDQIPDPYRPRVADGLPQWSSIDLSPLGVDKGLALVWLPSPAIGPSPGVIDLGDDLDALMPRQVSRRLENALGITLDSTDRLRTIITELLILHGKTDGTRWRPLQANRRGTNRILLGELVFEAPVAVGTTITETWNSADSDSPDADLDWTELRSTDWDIVSNEITLKTTWTDSMLRAESDLASADHYAQARCEGNAQATTYWGMAVRFLSSAVTAYTYTHTHKG